MNMATRTLFVFMLAATFIVAIVASTGDAEAARKQRTQQQFSYSTDTDVQDNAPVVRQKRSQRSRGTSWQQTRTTNRRASSSRRAGSNGSGGGGYASAGTSCLPTVLKTRLAQIQSRFGAIQIVSAHRPGARINGSGSSSYHASCRAVDFVPPSGKYGEVVRWLYANHEGGVGSYTCMNHIHIDNGPYVRFSKCR